MRRAHAISILLLGCAETAEPGTPRSDERRMAEPPRTIEDAPIPLEWRLPESWVWVTETREGQAWAIGMPAMPRAMSDAAGTQRMVFAETPSGVVRLAERSDPPPTVIDDVRSGAWASLTTDEAWRGEGRLFAGIGTEGPETIAMIVDDGKLFMISVLGEPSLARPAIDSFTRSHLRAWRRVRHDEGRFAVEAPARVTPRVERSAMPHVHGLRGILDGNDFSAGWVESAAPIVAPPEVDMRASVAALPGVVTEHRVVSPREIRYRCRITDGSNTVCTVRTIIAGRRVYTIAVYAPSGTEPEWASRFIDSFALDP